MGNVQMEADQIRYKDSSGTYRNVQTGLAAAIAGGGGGSSTLAGLTDTDITTPTNGQVLAYDSTESKWVNAASASGATTLEGLTDTAISTPADGQVLTYDGTASKWENAAIPAQSIDGLSDTDISTPTDGQVLTYDATAEEWKNATPASGVTTLAALTDTDITTPSDGQVLTYDGTAEKWVNAAGGSGGGGEVYPAPGTEVKIGTWGSADLYRQVFESTDTGTTVQINITSAGIAPSKIRKITGGLYCTQSSVPTFVPLVYATGSGSTMKATTYRVYQQSNNVYIEITLAISNATNNHYYFVVDYTKS